MLQVREEVTFTDGRIVVRGKLVSRGKPKRADYVLSYKPNIPLAVIEAKDNTHGVAAGLQQGLAYAETLGVPFVFASNGDGLVFHDRTGASPQPEVMLTLDEFPPPDELWARYRAWKGLSPEAEKVVLQDYYQDGSNRKPRYYQVNAVNAAIEAIAKGQDRVLLVMATGTGKTYTAFQIIWRLWKAGRKKRILFLADRNVLVDQTTFIDPEAKFPVLVTTSRLLSTGVDAQTCRLIVLDRSVGFMTEFKQIVGGGTRLHADSHKFYFTVMDFRGATSHFADPEFDGEPVQIYEPGENDPVTPPEGNDVPTTPPDLDPDDVQLPDPDAPPDRQRRRKITVDGISVAIVAERVEYLDEAGKPVTESKTLRKRFTSLEDFLKRWKGTERKQAILEEVEAEGLSLDVVAEDVGRDLDPFDLICHVAFDRPPLTRRERADNVRKRDVFTKYGPQARAVLEALLDKYQDEGVTNLDDFAILRVPPFDRMGTLMELSRAFGGPEGFAHTVHELQAALYEDVA